MRVIAGESVGETGGSWWACGQLRQALPAPPAHEGVGGEGRLPVPPRVRQPRARSGYRATVPYAVGASREFAVWIVARRAGELPGAAAEEEIARPSPELMVLPSVLAPWWPPSQVYG
jgi:hypothetical protein